LRHVVGLRITDDVFRDAPVAGRQRHGFAAERLGEPKRVGNTVAFLLVKLRRPPAFDIKRGPWPVQPVGKPLGLADKPGTAAVFADTAQNALASRPGPRYGVRLHLAEQLIVYALGRPPQRELT